MFSNHICDDIVSFFFIFFYFFFSIFYKLFFFFFFHRNVTKHETNTSREHLRTDFMEN